ncbi:MAG: TetR/AcrR family transcriptional regulator [Oligoflexales bacterium]
MRPSKKQQVIDTATRLFCERGYQATGIDTVIEEAGVAKMTLYGNFKSKEELILECIRQLDDEAFEWYVKNIMDSTTDPRARVMNIFKVLHELVSRGPFHGCPFIRASTEYPDVNNKIHGMAASHKERMRKFFEQLVADAGIKQPKKVASKIQIIMEGTMAMVQVTGDTQLVKTASEILRSIVD